MHTPVFMPWRSLRVALPHGGRVQPGVRDRRGGVRSQGGDSIAILRPKNGLINGSNDGLKVHFLQTYA